MSARSLERTMPLRRWLAIGFIAILLSFFVPSIISFGILDHGDYWDAPGNNLHWAQDQAQAHLTAWSDPAWQAEMTSALADRNVEGTYLVNGAVVFRAPEEPARDEGQVLQFTETVDGVAYEAQFLTKSISGPPPVLKYVLPIAFVSVIAAISGAALFLRRTVVDPLAATSAAAGRIAVGELDVDLPGSRVREVAQVNSAFSGMSAALRASLEQQAKLEEERRLFIGAVAHDLRTPLFSLRGSLEGLATGIANTPEKRERYLTVAREKADNLERLIADLFDYTRLEYLEQEPRREPLDLNELMRRTGDGMVTRAEEKHVQLRFVPAPGALPIDADPHMLTRAIENVLDNALRHTPEGGAITLQTGKRGGRAWFSVADTGPGIAPADLPHIFTPLYRSETSRNRSTGGAGLGLAIARTMLRAHGGDLTARNNEEGGAVFEGVIG
jgi:signal transduction histidine kinase